MQISPHAFKCLKVVKSFRVCSFDVITFLLFTIWIKASLQSLRNFEVMLTLTIQVVFTAKNDFYSFSHNTVYKFKSGGIFRFSSKLSAV